MKRDLWLIMTIYLILLLSSCASLSWDTSKEVVSRAVKAKIASRDYVIDIPKSNLSVYAIEGLSPGDGDSNVQEPGYIYVAGDTLQSCMGYDFSVRSEYDYGRKLPFFSGRPLPSFKYRIMDYEVKTNSKNVTIVEFSINLPASDNKLEHKTCFTLKIQPSGGILVYVDESFFSGYLRL